MSRVLVTGSEGQLGRELQLIANEDFVFVSHSDLDITDISAVQMFLGKGKFDYIINCAAYTAVDKAEQEVEACNRANIEAVKNLADSCQANGSTLIHISSDYVYHPEHDKPLDELAPCLAKGIYAQSKLAGEQYVKQVLSSYYIIRTSWVYSSFGNNFVKTMLRLADSRSELSIVDDQIGSPTYAADLAKLILTIIKKGGQTGIYNYSNLGYISWAEFAEEIFKVTKKEVAVLRIPTSQYPTPAPRPLNSRLIKSKVADEFDIDLKNWRASLKNCLELL